MSDATEQNFKFAQPKRSPSAINWLGLALCPLVFWLLRGDIGSLIGGVFLLGLFGTAAHLIMSALEDEQDGDIRRHRVPRKITGSALIGVGVGILALIQIDAGLLSLVFAFMAFALCTVAFGIDQEMNLRVQLSRKTSKETRKLVDMAERVFAAIPMRVAELHDEASNAQARAFGDAMLDAMQLHADHLEALSEELRHVLTEAAEATDQFVDDFSHDRDPLVRRRYMVLLRELADVFVECLEEQAAESSEEDQATARDDRLFRELANQRAA